MVNKLLKKLLLLAVGALLTVIVAYGSYKIVTTGLTWSVKNMAHDLNTVPLPTSAKETANDQIAVPFPYQEKFSNGDEQWLLDRNTSNHFVLVVLFQGRQVAGFPIDGVGDTKGTGQISMGDKNYSVKTISLNNDKVSGWVTLSQQ